MKPSRKWARWVTPLVLLMLLVAALLYDAATSGLAVDRPTIAQADLITLDTHLRLYASETGSYPTTEQGLYALVRRPTTPPVPANWHQHFHDFLLDPWKRPYIYRFPSLADPAAFDLFSLGRDGIKSTDDIRPLRKVSH